MTLIPGTTIHDERRELEDASKIVRSSVVVSPFHRFGISPDENKRDRRVHRDEEQQLVPHA